MNGYGSRLHFFVSKEDAQAAFDYKILSESELRPEKGRTSLRKHVYDKSRILGPSKIEVNSTKWLSEMSEEHREMVRWISKNLNPYSY